MILILKSKSCPSLYGTTVCLRSRVTGNRILTHYRTTACMRSRVTGNKKNWFIILPQLASGAELLAIENWTDFGTEWEISNLDTCSVWSPYSQLGIIEDIDGIHGQRSVPGKKRHRNEVRRLCPSPSHGNSQQNYTSAMPCQFVFHYNFLFVNFSLLLDRSTLSNEIHVDFGDFHKLRVAIL